MNIEQQKTVAILEDMKNLDSCNNCKVVSYLDSSSVIVFRDYYMWECRVCDYTNHRHDVGNEKYNLLIK